ncbi:MAG: LamG domain-containing protein [Verrucomicrobiota bacterium]|jgi:hypothetical protein
MNNTSRKHHIRLSILLCAVMVHTMSFTGFAQTNLVLALTTSDSYVSVPSASDLQNPDQITVESWVYPPLNQAGWLLNKSDGSSGTSQRTMELKWETNGTMIFAVYFASPVGVGQPDFAEIAAPVAGNVWTHIAATYSTNISGLRLYTNGILAAATTNYSGSSAFTGLSLRQTSLPLLFGGSPLYPGITATGCMDEIRIWTTARSAQDIYGNMSCRLTGTEAGLAGYWNFDDGTANDLTGHGHNGTFVDGALAAPIAGNDVVHAGVCGAVLPPRTATATGVVTNGFVVAATITDFGYVYTNTPTVRIIGGGGSGAQAVAVVSDGVVIAVDVTDAGYGYTSMPVIIIDPPFVSNPVLGIAPMSLLVFSNLTVGNPYQLQQAVAGNWTNQPLSFTATNSIYAQVFAGVVGSGDYRLALLNPAPTQAFATAEVDNGFVVGSIVTSGGSGYVTAPTVIIVGGGGTDAVAFSQINSGTVTNIVVTDAGFGYTNTPIIQIGQPPPAAVSPTVFPVMQVNSASLAPYDNYQIQFTPMLGGSWVNWNGGLFMPTAATNSQFLFITNNVGFFRLEFVP